MALTIVVTIAAIITTIIAIGILMRGCGIDMGAGILSLLWPVTQFCIINKSISGEHLENQLILQYILAIIAVTIVIS